MFSQFWNTVFISPITQSLLWLNMVTGSTGIAIILLTLGIQLIMTPLRLPSLRAAKKIRHLQPQLNLLKAKHKEDKMAMAQAQMELYREHGVSPLGGILPTLLSIPIIIALYNVLLTALTHADGLSTIFLWFDLTKPDRFYVLPLLVAGAQFLMSQHMTSHPKKDEQVVNNANEAKKDSMEDMMQSVQTQMKYIFPLMSGFITATLPAGVGLYWLTSVVFAIIQHQVVERTE